MIENRGRRWTKAEKTEFWTYWKAGESQKSIAAVLGRSPEAVFYFAARHGGIAPRGGHRSPRDLSLAEREEISRGIAAGLSFRKIGANLGRSPSTISRELQRHGGALTYRATEADGRAERSALRPKACRLATRPQLALLIAEKLTLNWSPRQISQWLREAYPDDFEMQISHETIYRSLFVQARGVLKKELIDHLRRVRVIRHAKTSTKPTATIPNLVSISERPPEAEDRAVPGHWEGDLIIGKIGTQIATLVERKSRFTMLVKVPSKDATVVAKALSEQVKKLPAEVRRTLTWDRGTEMANHADFTLATNVPVYFCDPYSPWQRGTNENTNGLLRQYFPKGADLSVYSQTDLDKVAKELNDRPRMTLGWKTPGQTFASYVATTG